jgi:maleylacetoacetate isomerase
VGVDLSAFPVVNGIVRNLESVEAVRKGHWQRQEDTPEDLRVKE